MGVGGNISHMLPVKFCLFNCPKIILMAGFKVNTLFRLECAPLKPNDDQNMKTNRRIVKRRYFPFSFLKGLLSRPTGVPVSMAKKMWIFNSNNW